MLDNGEIPATGEHWMGKKKVVSVQTEVAINM